MGYTTVGGFGIADIIGIAWLVTVGLLMLYRLAYRVGSSEERMLYKKRIFDWDMEIQIYYFRCLRMKLRQPEDEKDEYIVKMSLVDFVNEISSMMIDRGYPEDAKEWIEKNSVQDARYTKKKGEEFDEIIHR